MLGVGSCNATKPTARLLLNILLSNCLKPMRWFGKMYLLGEVSMFPTHEP